MEEQEVSRGRREGKKLGGDILEGRERKVRKEACWELSHPHFLSPYCVPGPIKHFTRIN